ncbi:MAG: DUF2807 domain-containing protein [Bacteroidetes bacterium]|nr:DUF2807 domain-containing protein [Bacteroidota bacterium]
MRTSGLILFSLTLICFVYLTSCERLHKIEGNEHITTDDRAVSHFTEIRSEGSFEVYIAYDSTQSVKVEAEENLLPYIETEVHGSVLIIKTRKHRYIDNNYPIRIYVKTPSVRGLELSGSGKVDCDSMASAYLDLHVSGSGKISAIVSCNKIKAHISGSGNINLSGTANETDFDINGSGDIHSYNLQQDTCFADISGSGDMFVYVNKLLDVNISGSGKVHYKGNPVVNMEISGSGSVEHE